MKGTRFIFIIIIMAVAVVAGFLVLQLAEPAPPAAPVVVASPSSTQVNTVDVLVARAPIPVGTVITEPMIDKQPWPQNLALEGFIISGGTNANIVGKVARTEFQAREPLILSKIADPGDANFLAAALPPGMRAVTIATDAISGVAGYVFAGDHVDILLTHNVPGQMTPSTQGSNDRSRVTEVLVPNAKIIAVDIRPAPPQQAQPGQPAPPPPPPPSGAPANISLQVSMEDAQKLRLAERNGTLSLALRSIKDKEDETIASPSVLPDLTRAETAGMPKAGNSGQVIVVRGVKIEQSAAGQTPTGTSVAVPGAPQTGGR